MNKFIRAISLLTITLFVMSACNLPSNATEEPNAISTNAALTVQALLNQSTPFSTPTLPPAQPSNTAIPSNFPTSTSIPSLPSTTPVCDQAQFVSETIPDGTTFSAGDNFTKTWRLKNIGTCTWSGYALVFDSGEAMSGVSPISIGTVAPGQEVDLSANLKAPAANGTYRGYWRVRNASGILLPVQGGYQSKSFFVEIKVQNTATLPPPIASTILTSISGESGQVRSDGSVLSPPNTGDLDTNVVAEAFVSFDMTTIPAGATITKVVVDFSSYDTLGNPWSLGGDGCLRAFVQNYGSLDAGDFFSGDPTGAVLRWCGTAELSSVFENIDMKSVVQNAVGSSRLQLRIQFRTPTTNSNGVADMVRFGPVKLTVTYQ